MEFANENIAQDGRLTKGDWTLNDYRKYAPKELERNPDLYNTLSKNNGSKKYVPLTVETLEYYRRNRPEYLAMHPKEYARIMAEKREKELNESKLK